jgi:hypothetical protein
MAAVAVPNKGIIELVKAMGLDPKKIREITLNIPVDDVVTIKAVMYPDEEILKKLGRVIHRTFELHEKGALNIEIDESMSITNDINFHD